MALNGTSSASSAAWACSAKCRAATLSCSCRVAANSGTQTTQTVTNCQMVNTASDQRQIAGYDVEYRYRGEIYESRLNYDPGERLRVRVSVTPAD